MRKFLILFIFSALSYGSNKVDLVCKTLLLEQKISLEQAKTDPVLDEKELKLGEELSQYFNDPSMPYVALDTSAFLPSFLNGAWHSKMKVNLGFELFQMVYLDTVFDQFKVYPDRMDRFMSKEEKQQVLIYTWWLTHVINERLPHEEGKIFPAQGQIVLTGKNYQTPSGDRAHCDDFYLTAITTFSGATTQGWVNDKWVSFPLLKTVVFSGKERSARTKAQALWHQADENQQNRLFWMIFFSRR